MSEFEKMSTSDGLTCRHKGDECRRIASLHADDDDWEGFQAWLAKAQAWWKLANRLNHVYPDLEPPTEEA